MINKILWASDGSQDSVEAISYIERFAAKLGSKVTALYVIPDYFEVPVMDDFPTQKLDLLGKWIKETESNESDRLKGIAEEYRAKGIKFNSLIKQGVPHVEIVNTADEIGADLIVMGKGHGAANTALGGTALKVLRRSNVPVMIANEDRKARDIKNVLIPTDLYNITSRDLIFTLGFAHMLETNVISMSVVVIGDRKYPAEVVEHLRGNAYNKLTQQINEAGFDYKIDTVVKAAKNAYVGIIDYVKEKDIDLVVMNTYGGEEFRREEFIGSVAERVVQEAPCPVITVKPS